MIIVLPYEPIEKTDNELKYFLQGYERVRHLADLKIINHKNKPIGYKLKLLLAKHKLDDALVNVDITTDSYYNGTEMYWTLIPEVYAWACKNFEDDIFLTEPDVMIVNDAFFKFQHSSNAVYGPMLYQPQYDIVKYAMNEICKSVGLGTYSMHWNTCFIYTKDKTFSQAWLNKTNEINKIAASIENPLHRTLLMNYNEEIAFSLLSHEYNYIKYGTSNQPISVLNESYHHCDEMSNMSLANEAVNDGSYEYIDRNLRKLYIPEKDTFFYINAAQKYIVNHEDVNEVTPEIKELMRIFNVELHDKKLQRHSYRFKTA